MEASYLLDNNIYGILRKSPNGIAIRNFNTTILETQLIPTSNIKLRMTPYSVMEAVGVIFDDPQIKIPNNIQKAGVKDVFSYVLIEAKNYYLSVINRNDFLRRADKESIFTSPEGKDLEQKCIYKPLSSPSFEEMFAEYLAFDLAFKFDFPKEMEFDLNDMFFVNAFFTDYTLLARLSKFRLTKKFWDQFYNRQLNANESQSYEVNEVNKSMRLKNFKDYLDCDIIHFVTVGDYMDNKFRPTVAFTCDDGQTIVNRVMAYKTHIEYLKSNLDDSVANAFLKTIDKWQQGILVFCNSDGSVKNYIEVKEIKPF